MEKYNIDGHTFGFSIDGIKNNYSKKEDFFIDIINNNPNVNGEKLKTEVLEKVWNEAFPQKEKK
jgi:hypothetical protein